VTAPSSVAVVTGASEGIGKQTAIDLLAKGFFVIVHGRSEARAAEAAKDISKAGKSDATDIAVADFSSMKQARAMGEAIAKKHPRVDVLVNNAGIFANTRTITEDGFELTLAVNHFAHFVLTHALLDALERSDQGRVVHVSSGVHGGGEIDLDDFTFATNFSGHAAYATSKLMNVLFSNELARRLQNTRITSNALHPGVIATKLLRTGFGGGGASLESGSKTSVFVATDPSLAKVTGKYFSNQRETPASARARDEKLARAFYEKSCEVTGTRPR
jgi:NAD(P)-dependent dehydrogenase (short-subunit alcohol dehydrogenase family)